MEHAGWHGRDRTENRQCEGHRGRVPHQSQRSPVSWVPKKEWAWRWGSMIKLFQVEGTAHANTQRWEGKRCWFWELQVIHGAEGKEVYGRKGREGQDFDRQGELLQKASYAPLKSGDFTLDLKGLDMERPGTAEWAGCSAYLKVILGTVNADWKGKSKAGTPFGYQWFCWAVTEVRVERNGWVWEILQRWNSKLREKEFPFAVRFLVLRSLKKNVTEEVIGYPLCRWNYRRKWRGTT